MGNSIDIDQLFHRSRERIRDLGEVFTPESCVHDMLALFDQDSENIWGDENISFFEPCCGHGNIVTVIYKKRLEGFYNKAQLHGFQQPALYAVANAMNTLWAIDIDPQNVAHCKMRVLRHTLEFVNEKTGVSDIASNIAQDPDFFAHLLCAINWHIHENETLSSLSRADTAAANAGKTQAGKRWISLNGHRPIDFQTSWTDHFQARKADKLIALDFERSTRFIKNLLAGNERGGGEFGFADFLIGTPTTASDLLVRTKDRATG